MNSLKRAPGLPLILPPAIRSTINGMDSSSGWETRFAAEIERARQARTAGNEGMARVCARRAAGAAIGEYLLRRGLPLPGPSAYARLETLRDLPGLAPEVGGLVAQLLQRVNEDFSLPGEIDLVAAAIELAGRLGLEINFLFD